MASESEGITLRYELRVGDVAEVRRLTDATRFFRPDEVDVAVELAADRFTKGTASDYHFIMAEHLGRLAGYACYGPIACTVGSFDLYWIVVDPLAQGKGMGRQLLAETERLVAQQDGRRIYIETSGRDQYVPTQRFYERCGYAIGAVLKDFYDRGDDKIVYVKDIAWHEPDPV